MYVPYAFRLRFLRMCPSRIRSYTFRGTVLQIRATDEKVDSKRQILLRRLDGQASRPSSRVCYMFLYVPYTFLYVPDACAFPPLLPLTPFLQSMAPGCLCEQTTWQLSHVFIRWCQLLVRGRARTHQLCRVQGGRLAHKTAGCITAFTS